MPLDSCGHWKRLTGPEMPWHVWLPWDKLLHASRPRFSRPWGEMTPPRSEQKGANLRLAGVLASRCSAVYVVRTEHLKWGKSVRVNYEVETVIPLFLTEPKTGRTRYPTCTNTILGPSLCGQPERQMVHGNDPLQFWPHSNGHSALTAHTKPGDQSLEPVAQTSPGRPPMAWGGGGAIAGGYYSAASAEKVVWQAALIGPAAPEILWKVISGF